MSAKHILFKVASVSDNTNDFGLRGHIIVTRLGACYEVGLNYLNSMERGTVFKVPVTRSDVRSHEALMGAITRKTHCEIPRLLKDSGPPEVMREIWGKLARPS